MSSSGKRLVALWVLCGLLCTAAPAMAAPKFHNGRIISWTERFERIAFVTQPANADVFWVRSSGANYLGRSHRDGRLIMTGKGQLEEHYPGTRIEQGFKLDIGEFEYLGGSLTFLFAYFYPRPNPAELRASGQTPFKMVEQRAKRVDTFFGAFDYKPKDEMVGAHYFSEKVRYPAEGAVLLSPASIVAPPFHFLREQIWIICGLIGLGAAYVLRIYLPKVRAQLRSLKRAEAIEHLTVGKSEQDPIVGKRVGPYRIVDRLGAGGMAVVYKGVKDELVEDQTPEGLERIEKEAVAIKLMHHDLSQNPQYRERFERETRICKALNHPYIVQLHDWGDEEGRLYLVMEFVRGKPLRDCVPEGGFPYYEAISVIRPILLAVSFAHQKGVVHRDLKPENVMFLDGGKVKVMDFGLARDAASNRVTQTGSVMGTPAYMAPEQIAGNEDNPNPASDQYALGILIYELLCGRLPFSETDASQLIFKHLYEEPPPVREFRPDLPAVIDDVVMRMLAKDPNARFPSVVDALDALEEAIAQAQGRRTAAAPM